MTKLDPIKAMKEKAAKIKTTARAKAFIDSINENYKGQVAEFGGKYTALKMPRFSSGILDLDLALGGGWPFGKISLIAGEYSTGKTHLCIKACESIENYDHKTKLHRDFLEGKPFEPGSALIVDVENSWDQEWAEANGFNCDLHVVARPEYSEQAVDIITTAIRENAFDLIILDSLAMMTPEKEITESSEDWQMGLAARINNKAFRRWNSSLAKMCHTGNPGPQLIVINQFRLKIGTAAMFGDPRTLPGGKGQEFVSSIIIYTKSQKYEDGDAKELSKGDYRGVVHKNKTFVPRQNYSYTLRLKKEGDEDLGYVNNAARLVKAGKRYKLIAKKDKEWTFGTRKFSSEKLMTATIDASPTLRRSLWRSIIKAACGQTV